MGTKNTEQVATILRDWFRNNADEVLNTDEDIDFNAIEEIQQILNKHWGEKQLPSFEDMRGILKDNSPADVREVAIKVYHKLLPLYNSKFRESAINDAANLIQAFVEEKIKDATQSN
jgi:hypothetical protein